MLSAAPRTHSDFLFAPRLLNRAANQAAFLILIVLTQVFTGCDGRKKNPDKSLPTSDTRLSRNEVISTAGYVADDQCRLCHSEIYQSYQSLGMSRSFYPASAENVIEDFERNHYYHSPSDQHFEMHLREDGIYQQRYQVDERGNRINSLEIRVDYIIGSGNHIRTYVYRTPSGELFQMPLAWYSNSREWAMNPGYDQPEHLGFDRKITRECMFCHNAYPTVQPFSDTYWQPHIFSETLPHGIGCQRCHGPGQQHIELAESLSATQQDIAGAIVNPKSLSAELSEDVCNQCHLQPSTQVLTQLVRADRSEYSYRPGQPLSGYRALLDFEDQGEERFEINHHAYRMRQSSCYLESNGGMSCLTCHDPHQKVSTADRIQHYRNSCLRCHQLEDCWQVADRINDTKVREGGPENITRVGNDAESARQSLSSIEALDCVECHMPKRRTHDVIHVTMTDHKIQANPDAQMILLAEREEPSPAAAETMPFDYWPERNAADGVKETELYISIAGSNLGNQRSLQTLANYLSGRPHAALLPLAEFSKAIEKRGSYEQQLLVLQETTKLYPDHVQVNLEMGMALSAAGLPEQALVYYQRSLEIGPALPETHLGLGMSMLHRGEIQSAEEHFREALRLRPLYADALLNLGIVLFSQQRWDEARDKLLLAKAVDLSMREADPYLDAIPK